MKQLLAQLWWVLAVRGAVAVLLGILALVWPGITLLVLVALFAAFAMVAGVVTVAGALKYRTLDGGWWIVLLLGVVSLAVGVIAAFQPGATLLALVLLMAAYAIVIGVLDIVVAVRLRKLIEGEWALIVAGAVSILFGVAVAAFPPAGALALAFLVGFYAITTGILLLVLAFQARRWQREAWPHERFRGTSAHPTGH